MDPTKKHGKIYYVMNRPHLTWQILIFPIILTSIFIVLVWYEFTVGLAGSLIELFLACFFFPFYIILYALFGEPVVIFTDKYIFVQSWIKYLFKIDSGKKYDKQFVSSADLNDEYFFGGHRHPVLRLAPHIKESENQVRLFQLFKSSPWRECNKITFTSLVGTKYLKNELKKVQKIQDKWM